MDNMARTLADLESEIQYLKKLLDENGINYDYEAHLRAMQSDVGDIIFPELGPEHASLLYSYFKGRRGVYALQTNKTMRYSMNIITLEPKVSTGWILSCRVRYAHCSGN